MRETLTVVRKDFAICGKAILVIMALAAFFLFTARDSELLAILLFLPVLTGMMCFVSDPPDSLAVFALPLRRKSLVSGRYSSTVIVFVLSLGLYVSLTYFSRRPLNGKATSLIVTAVALSVSIMYPLYYRLPQKWALGITAFIMTIIASISLSFAIVATKTSGETPVLFESIWQVPFLPLVMSMISIAMYLGSLIVSLRIISRKVL